MQMIAPYMFGKKTVIRLDISAFFESVDAIEIKKLWQYFFHFPLSISKLLTQLTTHQEYLPRGAPSSTPLANLIFWDVEPKLVGRLEQASLTYSRYVDDITISASRKLSNDKIGWVIGQVYGMFFSKNIKPNRDKRQKFV